MKTLFIGGQEDGRWLDVPEDVNDYTVPKIRDFFHVNRPPHNDDWLYKREVLMGKGGRAYSVMMLANSGFCLIDRLISGYRN